MVAVAVAVAVALVGLSEQLGIGRRIYPLSDHSILYSVTQYGPLHQGPTLWVEGSTKHLGIAVLLAAPAVCLDSAASLTSAVTVTMASFSLFSKRFITVAPLLLGFVASQNVQQYCSGQNTGADYQTSMHPICSNYLWI